MKYRSLKRGFDIIIGVFAFVLALPIFIITIILLLIANRGRVFFTQIRPGKDAIPFQIIKFKTMNDRKDADGNLLGDGVRLTTIGKWVRRLSLDEIPQLLNVIKGDMSLGGSSSPYCSWNTYLCTIRCRCVDTKSDRESVVGHRSMDATPSVGKRSLSWMCIMSSILPSSLMLKL